MEKHDIENEFRERIGQLESCLRLMRRRSKLLSLGLITILAMMILWPDHHIPVAIASNSPPSEKILRTQKLEIVDGDGKVGIAMTFDHGFPLLRMPSVSGATRLELDAFGLAIYDDRATKRIHLGLFQKGSAPRENARLAFFGEKNRIPLELETDWSFDPSISLSDSNIRQRISVEIINDTPGIQIWNKGGDTSWRAP